MGHDVGAADNLAEAASAAAPSIALPIIALWLAGLP
jgi:hypothetical protein